MADAPGKASGPLSGASSKPQEHEKRTKKSNPISIRKMERQRDELEAQISRCEAEIAGLEVELGCFKSAQESIRVAALIEERRTRLKQVTEQWEQVVVHLERECSADQSRVPSPKLN
jgi:chromosome segregation ATPase